MKAYIIKYERELVCVTNSPTRWLKENNKQRKQDGNEIETEYMFNIEQTELFLFDEAKE